MAKKRTNLQERYELREALGRGGMGVVYKAYDTLMKRDVALKTILDVDNPETVALFYKEWTVLTTMVHPNVINIYDIGEFEHHGAKKPFFVMPLLPGVTLDKLIKERSPRLSVQGVIDILRQACMGLHAAHEQGLIHRDVKPSNIFVMDDNSVKIIDFGIARAGSAHTKTTLKGTVFYLAPEQLEMKPPSPLSDLFALGVVTYEAFTRRRPFTGSNDSEVVEAIRRHVPRPISELNHEVNYAISQVVHKAMAKLPWHRFVNVREYGDALQKAFRNEPLEYFDSAKIKPRLENAAKSFAEGDYDFASDVLTELEAEGYLDQEIALLRGQVTQAVRTTRIQQALDNARRFFAAMEYTLALRKIQEALDLDPNDVGALALKGQVDKERGEKKLSEWIALARQHLEKQAFRQAREALDNVLQLKPNETDALRLLAEVERQEQETDGIRAEKSRIYQAAVQAWEKGELSSALTKLEVLVAMDRDQPESESGRSSTYRSFYTQVHSEHDALKSSYDEARRQLSADNFEAALAICKQYLAKYPNHALFQALKFDVEERQRHNLSAVIAETDRKVEEEPDLERRKAILAEKLKLYPGETHFERAVQLVRDKLELVDSIIAKARFFEEREQFVEALDQWHILKAIHEKHPGLALEIQRVIKRRDEAGLKNSKARWLEQTGTYLEGGDYGRAMSTVRSAQESTESRAPEQGLESLREAHDRDPRNTVVRTELVNTLVSRAGELIDSDWESAEPLVKEALQLQPNHAPAQSLESQIVDRKRAEFIEWCLAQARRLQAEGDLGGAMAIAVQGLSSFPNEPRLQNLQATLERAEVKHQLPPAIPPPPSPPREPTADDLFHDAVTVESPSPLAPPSPPQQSIPQSQPRGLTPDPRRKLWLGAAAGAIVITALLFAVGPVYRWLAPKKTVLVVTPLPPVARYTVRLHSSPAGAEILVNGEPCGKSTCAVQLAPGDHHAEASLRDYEMAAADFHVATGQPTPPEINLTLRPVPPLVTIATDLTGGTVLLDKTPARQIQKGDLRIPTLDPGKHTLSVQEGAFRANVSLEIEPGTLPKLTAPIETQGMQSVVVIHAGKDGRVYSSQEGGTATLDGKPAGALGRDGLALNDLAFTSHELVIEWPHKESRKFVFDAGSSPSVFASFITGQLAVLTITANQDDADVYLNGEKNRLQITHGRLKLYLKPKLYSIRVQKPGFPGEEKLIELGKAEETTLDFNLTAAKAAPVSKPVETVISTPPPAPPPAVVKPAPLTFGMADWAKTGDWTREGEVLTRKGGDFILAPPDLALGTIEFTVTSLKGKRVEWLTSFHDQKNYYLFQLDESELTRYEVVDGKRSKAVKSPLGFRRNGYVRIRLGLMANGILIAVQHDQGPWRSVDAWVIPSGPPRGKFGFHIPERDQLGMSDFRITAN